MARTEAGALLSQQHRAAQIALRSALISELLAIWPAFDPRDFATFDTFLAAARILISARHDQSAILALRYLADFRNVEEVVSILDLPRPRPLAADVVESAIRGAGILGFLNGRRSGYPIEAALRNAFVRVAGAASSLVLAGARGAILDGIAADPAKPRWQRVTGRRACAFCAMLASRGPVYRGEDSARFRAHDHCSCIPEPAYSGSTLPDASRGFRQQWRNATAGLSGTDALNAFRRSLEGEEEPAAESVA